MRASVGGSVGCPDRRDVADSMWSLLAAIDDGRVQATDMQRSYLEGAAVALAGMVELDQLAEGRLAELDALDHGAALDELARDEWPE